MNLLEKALANPDNEDLNSYLDIEPTAQIRRDVEEIKRKASDESEATRKLAAITAILNSPA